MRGHLRGERETPLVRGCLQYLRLVGIPAWRVNTGAVKIDGRYVSFHGAPGHSDIIAIVKVNGLGVAVFVECKSPDGRQRRNQKLFQQMVGENGGLYLLVRDVEQLIDGVTRFRGTHDLHRVAK